MSVGERNVKKLTVKGVVSTVSVGKRKVKKLTVKGVVSTVPVSRVGKRSK